MRVVAMAILALVPSGCFTQVAGGARFHGASPRGADVGASIGGDPLRLVADLSGYGSGPDARATGEFDVALAVSPVGWLRGEVDRAPWVDAGALVGYGAGATGGGGFWSGLFGGWVDVRLTGSSTRYPALHVSVVREIYSAAAPDATVLVFGLAWTWRDPHFAFRIDG